MPGRQLREGILDSRRVTDLYRRSPHAEVFYRRLMSIVDDYGRYEASPDVLRGKLYSRLLDQVTEEDVARWLADCVRLGLVLVYHVHGEPYLEYLNLRPIVRARSSRFPAPPDGAHERAQEAVMTAFSPEPVLPAPAVPPPPPDPPANGRGIRNADEADDGDAKQQAWQIEQATAVCRQHGYTANEINAVLKKVRDSGESVTAWTRYLVKACENYRRKSGANGTGGTASGSGPPGVSGESMAAQVARKRKAEQEAKGEKPP